MSFAATPDEVLIRMADAGDEAAHDELVRRGLRFSREQLDWARAHAAFVHVTHYDRALRESAPENPLVDFT